MHRQIMIFVLITILTSGCQTGPSALDEAATMIAQTVTARPPTATPTATSTPLPTNTPTPLPTTTQDIDATATAQASEILSEISSMVEESVPYADGHLIWQQSGTATIQMSGPATEIQEIDDPPMAGDFIIKSDVTWSTSGLILCGIIFRSEANVQNGKQYQFLYLRLSGLPAWAIEVHEFGQFRNSPTRVKFSDALDLDNGATNELILVVEDETFTLYINSKRQGKYYDYSKQRQEGTFAFLGSQDSGEGSCTFENSWVWALK